MRGHGGGYVLPVPQRLYLRPGLGQGEALLILGRDQPWTDAAVDVAGDPPIVEQAERRSSLFFLLIVARAWRIVSAVRPQFAAEPLGQLRPAGVRYAIDRYAVIQTFR